MGQSSGTTAVERTRARDTGRGSGRSELSVTSPNLLLRRNFRSLFIGERRRADSTAVCDLSAICRGFRSAWSASPVSGAERRIRNRRLVPPTIARNPARLPGRGTPCSALGYRSSRCTEPSIWWCRSTPAAFLSAQGVLVPGHSQRKQLRSRESLDIRPDGPNRVIDAARCRGCLRTSLAHPEGRGRLHANL